MAESAPPPLSRRQTPIPFNINATPRPLSPIGVSSEAISTLQRSLDEFSFHHSGLRESALGPLVNNLASTHPSQSEALLLTVLLAVHQQNQQLSTRLMLLETKTPIPEKSPSTASHQKTLSDLNLSIVSLSTKVERLTHNKSAPPPAPPAGQPPAKKTKSFADVAKSAPPPHKAKKQQKAPDGKEET